MMLNNRLLGDANSSSSFVYLECEFYPLVGNYWSTSINHKVINFPSRGKIELANVRTYHDENSFGIWGYGNSYNEVWSFFKDLWLGVKELKEKGQITYPYDSFAGWGKNNDSVYQYLKTADNEKLTIYLGLTPPPW